MFAYTLASSLCSEATNRESLSVGVLYECVVELFQVATRASSFEFEEVGNIDSIFSSKRSVRSRVGVGRCRKDCYLTSEQAEIYSSQPQIHPQEKFVT